MNLLDMPIAKWAPDFAGNLENVASSRACETRIWIPSFFHSDENPLRTPRPQNSKIEIW